MKNLVYVSLATIALLSMGDAFSMRRERESIQVTLSNQTDSKITVVTPAGNHLAIEPYSDKEHVLHPDYTVVQREVKVTTVVTPQVNFYVDFNGMLNIIYVKRGDVLVSKLIRPQNPIIVFETINGKVEVQVKECGQ